MITDSTDSGIIAGIPITVRWRPRCPAGGEGALQQRFDSVVDVVHQIKCIRHIPMGTPTSSGSAVVVIGSRSTDIDSCTTLSAVVSLDWSSNLRRVGLDVRRGGAPMRCARATVATPSGVIAVLGNDMWPHRSIGTATGPGLRGHSPMSGEMPR